jgi:hypothetical protein
VDTFGAVAGWAAAGLIAQAAGNDLAVGEAMVRKLDEYIRGLLADAGPAPSYAEWMAAVRAAHNWVAVNTLECLAAQYPPGGAIAAALDRRVSRAERRLNTSLKALAVLRRLRRPKVPAQVNVAAGPMVVNNGGAGAGR